MRLGQTATPLPRIQDSYGFGLIKKPAVFKLRDHGRVLTPRRALDAFSDCAPAVFRKLNVRYATEGVFAYTPNVSNTVRDSRFENCQTAVGAYYGTMTLTNLILCNDSIQYSNHGSAYIYSYATTTNCYGSVRFTTLTDGKVLSGITNLPVEVVTGDNLLESVYLDDIGNPVNGFSFNSNYTPNRGCHPNQYDSISTVCIERADDKRQLLCGKVETGRACSANDESNQSLERFSKD